MIFPMSHFSVLYAYDDVYNMHTSKIYCTYRLSGITKALQMARWVVYIEFYSFIIISNILASST